MPLIADLRTSLLMAERNGPDAARLFAHEAEYLSAPDGISVVVPVHDDASGIAPLLLSLRNQSLSPDRFEAVFALTGCSAGSRAVIDDFATTSGVATRVLEDAGPGPNIARTRNAALQQAQFRLATFVDQADHLSRDYLAECVALGDCRSVVVANVVGLAGLHLTEASVQTAIAADFETSHVHGPNDIALCCSAYTLNAIKTAPTYMLRHVRYDETLTHGADLKYWRDVFHMFMPITVKSPTRCDLYYQSMAPAGVLADLDQGMRAVLDDIRGTMRDFPCGAPQRIFDTCIDALLRSRTPDPMRGWPRV